MMKKNSHFLELAKHNGNAMIYVLIVVALFAALNFVLTRQSDTSETGTLATETAEIYATDIQQTAYQISQAIDQMLFSGSRIDLLNFVMPDDEPDFSNGTNSDHIHKVFHPLGGGVIITSLDPESVNQNSSDPAPGWYLDAFNNVEWTNSTAIDIILVAHQISKPICEIINRNITSSSTIPVIDGGATPAEVLINDENHTGTNADFDIVNCAACEGYSALCISNAGGTEFSYYNILRGE